MAECSNCPIGDTCDSKGTCEIENNPNNHIKKVIAVMSGKGGVGKSTVTTLIAKELNDQGYKVGILDADITGPSIPRLMQASRAKAFSNETGIFPVESKEGIKIMSLNFLVEEEDKPVIWRGPIIGSAVKQFWTDVIWGDLDYLLIDMPPGTGDVALTVMQSIPINGIVVVTTPHDMVSMIVAKSINMAKSMKTPVIGLVENMSYILCPDCGKKIKLFETDDLDDTFEKLGVKTLGSLPMCREIAELTVKNRTEDKLSGETIIEITKEIIDYLK